jgi:hypothetical protein
MTGGVQRAPARQQPGEARRQGAEDKPEPSDRELEDLAQKLYARIGRQLRRELLVDRERAGMAVDLVR